MINPMAYVPRAQPWVLLSDEGNYGNTKTFSKLRNCFALLLPDLFNHLLCKRFFLLLLGIFIRLPVKFIRQLRRYDDSDAAGLSRRSHDECLFYPRRLFQDCFDSRWRYPFPLSQFQEKLGAIDDLYKFGSSLN